VLVANKLQAQRESRLEARERVVKYYLPVGRPAPFGQWRDGFSDHKLRAAIAVRVARLRGGNFSDSRAVGDGVIESRIDIGPGYRIYYGSDGDEIILLCGGDKSTQDSDIRKAQIFWKDYKERAEPNAKERRLQSRPARRPPR
jgi:putative addiction module killer protein